MTIRLSWTERIAAQAIEFMPQRYSPEKASVFGPVLTELLVAGFGLCALLLSQLMLSAAIHDTNYFGNDGKQYQSTIMTAFNLGGIFNLTNFNPIEGIGTQLIPLNVWVNPAYWPFAFFGREFAADISAAVGLAMFMIGCYIMARCFDVAPVPSVIAAQFGILLFGPTDLLFSMPSNFLINPGSALVYALHMVALGLLARFEPTSPGNFAVMTAVLFAVLFYSVLADPLWAIFNGITWAVPFAIVVFGSLRPRRILIRCAALACCFAIFLGSGILDYLYTLSQYTARVQFADTLDRVRGIELVSALSFSVYMKTFYLACVVGWVLGLLTLRGRPRLLVVAAAASGGLFVIYCMIYLLVLNAKWLPPIPLYVEHSLFVLFLTAAVAGYWGVLRKLALWAVRASVLITERARTLWKQASRQSARPHLLQQCPPEAPLQIRFMQTSPHVRLAAMVMGLILVAVLPASTANFAMNGAHAFANLYSRPLPDEPELVALLVDNTGLAVGKPFRGASGGFWTHWTATTDQILENHSLEINLWLRGVPTVDEYSQLVTPQLLYYVYRVLGQNVLRELNAFRPLSTNWKGMQLFGLRYLMGSSPLESYVHEFPLVTLPYRPYTPPSMPETKPPSTWYIYELPRPNLGDYSPTEVVTAQTGDKITAVIAARDFDFTRQAVVSEPINESLVPAHNMQVSIIRNGIHVSGKSDGTSLVVLPYQFSNCLRPSNRQVRLVRTNLMMAGLLFSGDLDTDIVFDYGLFSPACRRADIADTRQLDLKIDHRMPHLSGEQVFPDWDGAVAKLRAAATALRLDNTVVHVPVIGPVDVSF
jgi:hypothetical protein